MIFSRISEFFSHVFLVPEDKWGFEEIFIDKNPQYKPANSDWSLDGAFIALAYNDSLQRELERFKYFSRREKSRQFVEHLARCYDLFLEELIDNNAIFTSVPLFFIDRWKRWYNQSELLSKGLAAQMKASYRPLLRKIRWTQHQAKLDRAGRLRNLQNAFILRWKYRDLKGATIILVDDIISTGSTANECAKVLKKAGAKCIYGLFLGTGD